MVYVERIHFNDINLENLQYYTSQGKNSVLYRYESECIKILTGSDAHEKASVLRKFLEMEGISTDAIISPNRLIVGENGELVGYTMDYFANSVSLYDYFLHRKSISFKDVNEILKRVSLGLRKIHSCGIVIQDLSFGNILINQDGVVKFCDIDGCSFGSHDSPFISCLLNDYIFNFKKLDDLCVSENTDRLSLLLDFIYLCFFKEIQNIGKKDFYKLSDRIRTLDNWREIVSDLINCDEIPIVPYYDELVYDGDDCIIDIRGKLEYTKKY